MCQNRIIHRASVLLKKRVARDEGVEGGLTTRAQEGGAAQHPGRDKVVPPVATEVVQPPAPHEGAVQEFRVPANHDIDGVDQGDYDGRAENGPGIVRSGCGEGGFESSALGEGAAEFDFVVENLRAGERGGGGGGAGYQDFQRYEAGRGKCLTPHCHTHACVAAPPLSSVPTL